MNKPRHRGRFAERRSPQLSAPPAGSRKARGRDRAAPVLPVEHREVLPHDAVTSVGGAAASVEEVAVAGMARQPVTGLGPPVRRRAGVAARLRPTGPTRTAADRRSGSAGRQRSPYDNSGRVRRLSRCPICGDGGNRTRVQRCGTRASPCAVRCAFLSPGDHADKSPTGSVTVWFPSSPRDRDQGLVP